MDELKNEDLQDNELERYGVWVKAGPEEVVEADDDFAFTDLPGGESAEDMPSDDPESVAETGDAGFSEDDEFSLDDLDFPDEIDPVDDEGHGPLGSDPADTGDHAPEVVSLDLEDDEDELAITPTAEAEDSAGTAASAVAEDDDLVSLDDLDIDVPDEEPDPFATLEDDGLEEPAAVADSGSDDDSFDLDEITEDLPDDFEEMDLDAADPLAGEAPEDFEASMPGSDDELGDISEDDIPESASAEDLPELEVDIEDLDSDEHDFTPENTGIEIVPESSSNRLSPDEEEFLEDDSDLQNGSESAIPPGMDLQEREAFQRIQTELSDIKRELSELKAALRAGVNPLADDVVEDEPAVAEAPADAAADEAAPGPGFFDEEEDETIALTGDELDNILNTAEFTEEVGEEAELEDEYLVEPPAPDAEAAPESTDDELPVQSIELEPVADSSSVFEGDESAVDELAEMDIDRELADIDQLSDDTSDEDESSEIDDLNLDVDDLDVSSVDDDDDILGSQLEEAGQEAAAAADQQALAAEPDLDDLEVEDVDLDEPDTAEPETSEDDFDDFAAAVEEDIASGGVETDDSFDAEESVEEDVPAPAAADEDAGEEIEIDLDDFDSDAGDDDLAVEDLGAEDFTDSGSEDEGEDLDVGDLDAGDFDLEAPDATDDEQPVDEPVVEEPVADEIAAEEPAAEPEAVPASPATTMAAAGSSSISDLPEGLKQEIRSVLSYMDQLLEALPDDKIEEFAHSEHFEVYKRLFEELGLETEG